MLGWLFSWLTNRESKKRQIFCFSDGTRTRRADPMQIRRALLTDAEFSWDSDPAILANEDGLGRAALARTLGAINRAFGVQGYDEPSGRGLTEDERLSLYLSFMEWLQKKSATHRNSPTSQPSTTSIPAESPTPSGSDSSSIETALPFGEPSLHASPSG